MRIILYFSFVLVTLGTLSQADNRHPTETICKAGLAQYSGYGVIAETHHQSCSNNNALNAYQIRVIGGEETICDNPHFTYGQQGVSFSLANYDIIAHTNLPECVNIGANSHNATTIRAKPITTPTITRQLRTPYIITSKQKDTFKNNIYYTYQLPDISMQVCSESIGYVYGYVQNEYYFPTSTCESASSSNMQAYYTTNIKIPNNIESRVLNGSSSVLNYVVTHSFIEILPISNYFDSKKGIWIANDYKSIRFNGIKKASEEYEFSCISGIQHIPTGYRVVAELNDPKCGRSSLNNAYLFKKMINNTEKICIKNNHLIGEQTTPYQYKVTDFIYDPHCSFQGQYADGNYYANTYIIKLK